MSIKIFSFKGLNGVVSVLSIVIPVVTWLAERIRKKEYESVTFDTGGNAEKSPLEKSS
jgi:hypothetical protein